MYLTPDFDWTFIFPTHSGQAVLWLNRFSILQRIIYQSKACTSSTTKYGLETKAEYDICCCFVHFCQLLTYFSFRNIGFPRVKNVYNLEKNIFFIKLVKSMKNDDSKNSRPSKKLRDYSCLLIVYIVGT